MRGMEQALFSPDTYKDCPFDIEVFKNGLIGKAEAFYNMDVLSISRKLGIPALGKESVRRIANGIIEYDKNLFRKAKIYPKIYVMYPNSPSTGQHVSLPTFLMKRVDCTDWWNSDLRKLIMENEFLFMVFENEDKKPKRRLDKNIIFKEAFFWKMPLEDVEEVAWVYNEARKVIRAGVEVYPFLAMTGKVIKGNNLPRPTDNRICHVRPHGNPKTPEWLPSGESINQQSFWLNAEYVQNVISSHMGEKLFR